MMITTDQQYSSLKDNYINLILDEMEIVLKKRGVNCTDKLLTKLADTLRYEAVISLY